MPSQAMLSRCQTERGGKDFWNAEQLDRDLASRWSTSIANESFFPREAIVRSLRARKDDFRFAWRSGGWGRQAHLNALVSHELHTGAPVFSSAPIAPEERSRTNGKRMQQDADLARLCCRAAIPLALLAQRTRAALTNAGRVDHTQTPICFSTPLLRSERSPCWTAQRPIRLERKVSSREATRFPGRGSGRWTIARGRS